MNIHDIGNRLLHLMNKFRSVMKDVFKLPYIKTYIAVSLVLIALFLIITFPYDVMIRNQLQKLELSLFKSVYIRDIQTSLVDISTLKNIIINIKDDDELSMKDVSVNMAINPYTVFFKKILKGDIAVTGLRYSSKEMNCEMNVNGNLDVQMDNKFSSMQNGKIKLMIQNGIVKLTEMNVPTPIGNIPVTVPDLKISSMNIDTTIINRNLRFDNFTIIGPDIKGSITGTMTLAALFSNSGINLEIVIDPQSRLIENFKDFLTSYTGKDGKIHLPVKGTVSQPRLDTTATSDNTKKPAENITKPVENVTKPVENISQPTEKTLQPARKPGVRKKVRVDSPE